MTAPVLVDRPEQVRALASPTAHQIVCVMERLRRATVAEIARHTGVEAGSLYYHVRRLQEAGVLAEHGRRKTGGRDEVVYELPGSEVVFSPEASSPGFLRELRRAIRMRLRYVERAMLAALGRPGTVRRRRGRNLSLHQHHARLRPARRAELYRRIEELEAFLMEHDDPSVGEFLSVTIAILPVGDRSGA